MQNVNPGFSPHLCLISDSLIPQPSSGTFDTSCQMPLLSFLVFSYQCHLPGPVPYLHVPGLLPYAQVMLLLGWKPPISKPWIPILSLEDWPWLLFLWLQYSHSFTPPATTSPLSVPRKRVPQALCTLSSFSLEHSFPRYSHSSVSYFVRSLLWHHLLRTSLTPVKKTSHYSPSLYLVLFSLVALSTN